MTNREPIIKLSKGTGKFIQLELADRLAFVKGREYSKHGSILENFLKQQGLEYDTFEVHHGFAIPKSEKDGVYRLVGAGHSMLTEKSLIVNGSSEHYRIGINKEHLEKIKPYLPEGIEVKMLY